MKSFKNKVAAITGAASGMGRELAVELAKRGCHVAISDVNEAGLAETAALARAHGVKVSTQRLDVANREAMGAWADKVAAEFGQVNLVFNNAGVALGATLDKVKPEDFQWIMGINFWGVVWGTQAFLPHLKKSRDGHIVNISSLFGLMAQPTQGTYNASKFAVRGFTESLRQELDIEACGVSATCVHPGGIRTNIARAAKLDPSVAADAAAAERARQKFDKLLNTTTANSAARQMLRAVEKNKRRLLIGPDAVFLDKLVRILGSWYQPIITVFFKKMMG